MYTVLTVCNKLQVILFPHAYFSATVGNLQAKVESLTTTNALMKEDLAIARNSLLALQAENQAMRQSANHSDNSSNGSGSDKDKDREKEKSQQAEALSSELAEERKKNTELDKELKLQVSLKAESDMAMKLLEKDIHEKQDTIVSLRRQLDDIKQINLEMYRKLQVRMLTPIPKHTIIHTYTEIHSHTRQLVTFIKSFYPLVIGFVFPLWFTLIHHQLAASRAQSAIDQIHNSYSLLLV